MQSKIICSLKGERVPPKCRSEEGSLQIVCVCPCDFQYLKNMQECIRGNGGLKSINIEHTYFLNGPINTAIHQADKQTGLELLKN